MDTVGPIQFLEWRGIFPNTPMRQVQGPISKNDRADITWSWLTHRLYSLRLQICITFAFLHEIIGPYMDKYFEIGWPPNHFPASPKNWSEGTKPGPLVTARPSLELRLKGASTATTGEITVSSSEWWSIVHGPKEQERELVLFQAKFDLINAELGFWWAMLGETLANRRVCSPWGAQNPWKIQTQSTSNWIQLTSLDNSPQHAFCCLLPSACAWSKFRFHLAQSLAGIW